MARGYGRLFTAAFHSESSFHRGAVWGGRVPQNELFSPGRATPQTSEAVLVCCGLSHHHMCCAAPFGGVLQGQGRCGGVHTRIIPVDFHHRAMHRAMHRVLVLGPYGPYAPMEQPSYPAVDPRTRLAGAVTASAAHDARGPASPYQKLHEHLQGFGLTPPNWYKNVAYLYVLPTKKTRSSKRCV